MKSSFSVPALLTSSLLLVTPIVASASECDHSVIHFNNISNKRVVFRIDATDNTKLLNKGGRDTMTLALNPGSSTSLKVYSGKGSYADARGTITTVLNGDIEYENASIAEYTFFRPTFDLPQSMADTCLVEQKDNKVVTDNLPGVSIRYEKGRGFESFSECCGDHEDHNEGRFGMTM